MKKNQSTYRTLVMAGIASIFTFSVACADDIFITNNGGYSIEEISNGVPSTFINTGLNSPTGLAFYGGDLFVANNSGNIAEFTSGGALLNDNYAPSLDLNNPRGIAFNSAGDLFVANQATGTIYEIAPGGGSASVFASGLDTPNGLAFDSSGNLYVSNGGNGVIDEITPSAVVTPFVTGLSSPNGLAFDSAGDLLVVNHNTSQVLEFSSTGTALPLTITDGTAGASLKTVGLDSEGNIYVTDNSNSLVTEYNASGTILTVFDNPGDFNGPCFITTLVVPEPSTYALLIAGLGLLFFMGRRKAKAATV